MSVGSILVNIIIPFVAKFQLLLKGGRHFDIPLLIADFSSN